MNVVKLGKKGQVSIPRSALRVLGIEDEQMMTVELSDDGAIVLHPAGCTPWSCTTMHGSPSSWLKTRCQPTLRNGRTP